jgi:hypothetical protein
MSSELKRYIVSADPSRFDASFKGLRWKGSGRVTVVKIDADKSLLRVVIEADQQGYVELKAAGFNVKPGDA